jgi:hypothetical protein
MGVILFSKGNHKMTGNAAIDVGSKQGPKDFSSFLAKMVEHNYVEMHRLASIFMEAEVSLIKASGEGIAVYFAGMEKLASIPEEQRERFAAHFGSPTSITPMNFWAVMEEIWEPNSFPHSKVARDFWEGYFKVLNPFVLQVIPVKIKNGE